VVHGQVEGGVADDQVPDRHRAIADDAAVVPDDNGYLPRAVGFGEILMRARQPRTGAADGVGQLAEAAEPGRVFRTSPSPTAAELS
jgi:hypothetical protein